MPENLTFTIPPHLNEYNVPFSTFKASNPQWTNFVVGGLVFSRSPPKAPKEEKCEDNQPRVLLLQRALTDSLPGYWEGPGGGCEDTDETILAAVAREVVEESGLHVSRIVDLVGVEPWTKEKNGTMFYVVKFTFLVEVYEAQGVFGEDGEKQGEEKVEVEGEALKQWEDRVRLEPSEHSAFEWATEEEVRLGLEERGKYKFLEDEGRNLLKAFRILEQ
ncbi:NUDIX hydrolase domain-like protein [Aspergillus leporis]|jgi:8-oxo-dGTP pyrophosphatase MutT (NUDIX family)|uniref:NUDIX hydrolase domain-like protein n=1 Tax=Aspergillus leporis TaxID=41062 RepID=A0A5N5XHR0_9EURO|nr:NUDIX hydrolase domain-like protein [Aspergillus leporis]